MGTLSPSQVAKLLQVTPSAVRQWIKLGKLDARRVGGRWRIRQADLDSFLERGDKDRPGTPAGPD